MSRFQPIADELESLKWRFTQVTNALWDLRLRRASAGNAAEFLPRRLDDLQNEKRAEYARLHSHLESLIRAHFERHLFVIESPDDLTAMQAIALNMAYIRNAFADGLNLGETVQLLQSALNGHRRS